jgi:hypothetical protein
MRLAALVIVLLLVSGAARAEETLKPPPNPTVFSHQYFVRTLVGGGQATSLPADDRSANTNLTFEWGSFPLMGSFGTGFSLSSALDGKEQWSVVTAGIFAKLDLTYLFISGLLGRTTPSPSFPYRLQFGGRLGVAASQSYRPTHDVPDTSSYTLVRPETESFFDFEKSLDAAAAYSLVVRGALDTSVNLSSLFRWSVSLGLNYGWDR